MNKFLFIKIYPILLFFLLVGCSKKSNEHIVAWIGPYDLSVSEYKSEASKLDFSEKGAMKEKEGKLAFLDRLIDRQVLLQEAQRLHLERDKRFRAKIEEFWKEALLEELIVRKGEELINNVKVTDQEIDKFYQKMKKRVSARIIITLDENTAKELLQKNVKEINRQSFDILNDSELQWFGYEELDPAYRDLIFSMEPGQKKIFFKQGAGWFLFFVDSYETRDLKPKEKMITDIEQIIKRDKELNAIDEWINSLRSNTNVVIDNEVLEIIDVELK